MNEAFRSYSLLESQLLPEAGSNIDSKRVLPLVRNLRATDIDLLLTELGPVLDSLYPNGSELFLNRLNQSLSNKSLTRVLVDSRDTQFPLALASEVPKGFRRAKLSTFWVHPAFRRLGLGSHLLQDRLTEWLKRDLESVHVTVRSTRAQELQALLTPFGFHHLVTDLDRYGPDQHEAVYQWRPDWLPDCVAASMNLRRLA